MSNEDIKMIEGSAEFLCAAVDLALGRIDLCKCSACGNPRDNGCCCGECGGGYCDPVTEDGHNEAAALAIMSYDPMALRIKELEWALTKIKEITGELGGQNPANFCEELAMEQDDATYRVYKLSNSALSKSLEQSK